MIRKILFLLIVPAFGFAQNAQDIPTIVQVSHQLEQNTRQLMAFADNLDQLNQNGFVYSIAGSTQTINLTGQQQQSLIAYYIQLKANLVATYNQLP